MLIATHPSTPGCAYILINFKLFLLQASEKNIYIQPIVAHQEPYETDRANIKAYGEMCALFRLITDTEKKQIVICSDLSDGHIVPEWLHALKIHNLNPTHESNTEHLIHTTAPRYIAHIHPDEQEIYKITAIDPIPDHTKAISSAQKFMDTL